MYNKRPMLYLQIQLAVVTKNKLIANAKDQDNSRSYIMYMKCDDTKLYVYLRPSWENVRRLHLGGRYTG